MLRVNLNKLPFFRSKEQVSKFNSLSYIHSRRLMYHQVANVTGLSFRESMTLLLYLFHVDLAELYILVYHVRHPEPIDYRSIFDGFPELPYFCKECEEEVLNENDLKYDYLFVLNPDVEFELEID